MDMPESFIPLSHLSHQYFFRPFRSVLDVDVDNRLAPHVDLLCWGLLLNALREGLYRSDVGRRFTSNAISSPLLAISLFLFCLMAKTTNVTTTTNATHIKKADHSWGFYFIQLA